MTDPAEPFWSAPLERVFGGRDVILVGAVPAAWNDHVRHLSAAGARRIMVVATEGAGLAPGPDVETIVVAPPDGLRMMERIRFANRVIAAPPADVADAVTRFDPGELAVVIGTFLAESPTFGARPLLAHRMPAWVALEDKTRVDELWDRAGVARQPSLVIAVGDAPTVASKLDRGRGTVWAGDAREGFHGGGHLTRWVSDPASQDAALRELGAHCDTVRVMPFVEGVPCSIHAIVLPDGAAVLRPVEMVTLRERNALMYAGCATYWDPPSAVRDQMRDAARRTAELLRSEVGFRGTFTIDGVAAPDGFWPTELNPRYGAGINTIARAVGDVPVLLLHDLAVAGEDVGIDAEGLESALVTAADAHRGGGTWLIDRSDATIEPTAIRFDGDVWHQCAEDEPSDATLVAGPGFARCTFDPARTPAGPSVGPRAAAFWNFAGPLLGARLAHVTAAAS